MKSKKKSKLYFGDFDTESDLEKEVDGEIEEIEKKADLYFNDLYTVIPESHDFTLGIFPDDQQLSSKGVFLWNSIKLIPTSLRDKDYKVLKVKIDSSKIKNNLKPHGNGIYTLSFIPNTASFEEVDNISFFSE